VLTEKEKQWLLKLAKFLEEHEEHDFREKRSRWSGRVRLVLTFPYATGIKDQLDKDRKNFDHRVDTIFNQKLYEAIYLIAFMEKVFKGRGLVRRVQRLAMEELEREFKRI